MLILFHLEKMYDILLLLLLHPNEFHLILHPLLLNNLH
jgi:hypothetical protein